MSESGISLSQLRSAYAQVEAKFKEAGKDLGWLLGLLFDPKYK